MKKPTIASLQKELADLEARRLSAANSAAAWQKDRHEINDRLAEAMCAARKEREALGREVNAEREARQSAETVYDMHRKAVLRYFMAVSNPETAKDVDSLKALQAEVCGLVPSRAPCSDNRQLWER